MPYLLVLLAALTAALAYTTRTCLRLRRALLRERVTARLTAHHHAREHAAHTRRRRNDQTARAAAEHVLAAAAAIVDHAYATTTRPGSSR